jgi:hypothetical protein
VRAICFGAVRTGHGLRDEVGALNGTYERKDVGVARKRSATAARCWELYGNSRGSCSSRWFERP